MRILLATLGVSALLLPWLAPAPHASAASFVSAFQIHVKYADGGVVIFEDADTVPLNSLAQGSKTITSFTVLGLAQFAEPVRVYGESVSPPAIIIVKEMGDPVDVPQAGADLKAKSFCNAGEYCSLWQFYKVTLSYRTIETLIGDVSGSAVAELVVHSNPGAAKMTALNAAGAAYQAESAGAHKSVFFSVYGMSAKNPFLASSIPPTSPQVTGQSTEVLLITAACVGLFAVFWFKVYKR